MVIIGYADYTDFQDYVKNNSLLTTTNASTIKITWWIYYAGDIEYAGDADIQLYAKNNFIIDYIHYVAIKSSYW